MNRGANRRRVLLGGLALCTAGASEAQPLARADLYNGELDYLAKDYAGRARDLPANVAIAQTDEPGERLAISGRALSWRSSEPVAGVIVYAYHTDTNGSYAGGPVGTRHARLRGWMRTNAQGAYAFTSIKPAPYPGRTMPAHIHLTVMEPGRPPYWIDDIVFEGEFKVDAAYRASAVLRGGDGVIALRRTGPLWTGVRDIRLERHPA